MAKASRQKWQEFDSTLIAAIDIQAEYRDLGIEFTSESPSPAGWVQCRAIDREDANPSAGVNIESGHYNAFGGGAGRKSLSLFEFYASIRGGDWRDARSVLAKKYGVKPPAGDEYENPADQIRFKSEFNAFSCRGFMAKYGITDAKRLAVIGCQQGFWPKSDRDVSEYPVLAFKVFAEEKPFSFHPQTFVIAQASGEKWDFNDNKGPRTCHSIKGGGTGIIGEIALRKIAAGTVSRIYKAEGVSDACSLQDIIPLDLLNSHVVVTNSGGAQQVLNKFLSAVSEIAFDAEFVVVGDSDEPGQDGAKLWCKAATGFAIVKNIVLDPIITPKKGRDLRDWIGDKRTEHGTTIPADAENRNVTINGLIYADFCRLVDATSGFNGASSGVAGGANGKPDGGLIDLSTIKAGTDDFTPEQAILNRFGLTVLGNIGDSGNKVLMFSEDSGETKSPELRSMTADNLTIIVGPERMKAWFNRSKEDDGRTFSLTQVRNAIATEAAKCTIDENASLGIGIWNESGKLFLVNRASVARWNGGLKDVKVPLIGNQIVRTNGEHDWYKLDELAKWLKLSESPDWCLGVVKRTVALFDAYDNWKYPDSGQMMAAIVLATWLQSIWEVRPIIGVTGETNAGKSFLFDQLKWIFGTSYTLYFQHPTEAAIRQSVRQTSKVLIVDEFDRSKRRGDMLDLFRTTYRGGTVPRGTAGQQVIQFGLKHVVFIGGIHLGLTEAADQNRVIRLPFVNRAKDAPKLLSHWSEEAYGELGQQLLAIALRHWRAALDLAKVIANTKGPSGIDGRLSEIMSAPTAILSRATGSTTGEAIEWRNHHLINRQAESDVIERQEDVLIQEIMAATVRYDSLNRTVHEWLSDRPDTRSDKALESIGIKVVSKDGIEQLVLHGPTVASKIFKGQKIDLREIILRLGAKEGHHRILGKPQRTLCMPLSAVLERDDPF